MEKAGDIRRKFRAAGEPCNNRRYEINDNISVTWGACSALSTLSPLWITITGAARADVATGAGAVGGGAAGRCS